MDVVYNYLLVGLGAFFGGILRSWLGNHFNGGESVVYHGTFLANVLGCFSLGVLIGLTYKHMLVPSVELMAGVGFCGGLTTFSTFSLEVFRYFAEGRAQLGLAYWINTATTAITAAFLGIIVVIGINGILHF